MIYLVGTVTLKNGTNTQEIKLQVGDRAGVEVNNVLTVMEDEFLYE